MAKSLTVQAEERPSASPLLIGLLVFAALWLTAAAVTGWGDEAVAVESGEGVVK